VQINEPNQNNANSAYFAQKNSNQNATKKSILTQNIHKAERRLKLRWIVAISCLPLFGIYAAFGIAPQTTISNISTASVLEEITLPESELMLDSGAVSAQNYWYKEHIRRDDTLSSLMLRLNIRNRDALNFIRNDSVASEIAASLRPGNQIEAQTDSDGNLAQLEYQLSADEFIEIKQNGEGYVASKVVHQLEKRPILQSAEIKTSLFAATDGANIPDNIAIQIAEMFESDIDFHTDLRRGDHLNVIYEGSYDQGALLKTGDVLAAEFINNGKIYRAVGYRDEANKMQFYTPTGASLHKSFLRSPLEFTRVSSSFSLGRFHPVLQRIRAHKGVDLAAPSGTRIKASADAVVSFVGVKGGYGNMIILNHAKGISTVYGHLSRFAAGLHRGEKVSQGDIIGFVGMTGMATGPHLHYEFLQNGEHRDPMTAALPQGKAISKHSKAKFDEISNVMTAQLKLLGASNIAALD
jgi:murein DD-endopeptidase MepM/ murein hydrolase activator NlpD